MMNSIWFLKWPITMVLCTFVLAQTPCFCDQNKEEALGGQYAAEFEKNVKLATDPAILERLNKIGQDIAKVANEQEVPATYGSSKVYQFKYRFKVIEDEDVNAMSLPGGIVYVNTGLLKIVESDDELAGVLAHEIAHAAHHHLIHLLRKRSSVGRYVALITLAGIIGNARSSDMNNLMLGAHALNVGKLSGYTQEAEKDADRTAVAYMVHAGYKPEGLLTFMSKLQEQHAANPSAPLGIYQTHPSPAKRRAAIIKAMREMGVVPNTGLVWTRPCAISEPVSPNSDRYRVVAFGKTIYEPAGLSPDNTSKTRADQIAANLNALLKTHLADKDIICDLVGNRLLTNGFELIEVRPEDADLVGKTPAELLIQAREAIRYAVWANWLADSCSAIED